MKKWFLIFLFICLPVSGQPLNLKDWKQPYSSKKVNYQIYTSILNCSKKIPYYVFYNLYPNEFVEISAHRKNKWPHCVPEEIKNICGSNYAVNKDYSNSGYDRGHLAPAANFISSQHNENLTFSFANAAPQDRALNRGEWEKLENKERYFSIKHNGITIITGVIQSKNNYIGNNVNVPAYYYKVFLWKKSGKINNLAFLAHNFKSKPQQVNIKYLEKLSGMNFGF